ncbi:MAG: glycosyltransferase family 87 protein [Flavobacterium sp.]|uniref:glycosyltransferase family 87 protein n=1 Tax=Flavobacterium sp. TaxID=239 RepID=UPI0032647FEB
MKTVLLKYYAFLPLLLLCAFYVYKAVAFPVHDFANYYFGSYFLREHAFTSNTYFPYLFNKEIVALGSPPLFAGFAPNTPFLAMLFYPFSFISLATAKLTFNTISAILFVISIYRLAQFYKINWVYLVLIPFVFFVPIRNELLFGQVYLLVFVLLTEFWLAHEKGQQFKAALFLCFAIFLKVFPVLLVLIFLCKKQFKPLFYMLGISVLFFCLSLLFIDIDLWKFYITDVLSKASNGEIATSYVDNYQSAFMFLKRLLVFDANENPAGLFNYPGLFYALIIGFKIMLIVIGYFISKANKNQLTAFSFWILACILISPYGSTYTFILMLFPFFALLKSEISKVKKIAFCGLLLLVNNLPLSFFMQESFPISYLRLLFLILLFGFFLFEFKQNINWKFASVITVIPIVLLLVFKKNEAINSTAVLEKSPLLIYDYKIENNQLSYFYWNEKGENKDSIPFESYSSRTLDIKDNQVTYKIGKLTFDKSHKQKPMLVDNKTVIYLSDYGRGIGFYTLRKIELH